jgi:DNA-binding beta-propeller fold protein YncE
MAHRQVVLLVAVLGASIFVTDVPAHPATRGYVVNPAGLLLTLDGDTDTVIGIHEIPSLARADADGRRLRRLPAGPRAWTCDAAHPAGDGGEAIGRSLLTPQGDRLLVLDPVPYGLARGYLIDEEPTGRIFVYDVVTGARLGRVGFSVRGADRLAAVHPRGDKAYVASAGPRSDQMTITVVSLTTFSVMKELFVPKGDFLVSQTAR